MIHSIYTSPEMYRQGSAGPKLPWEKHHHKSIFMIMLLVIMLSASVFFPVHAKEAGPNPEVKEVAYPVSLFDNGKARHFEYKANDGSVIRYFILKTPDGVIRAAFDACSVCWHEGKGYTQKGNFMVCNNCGKPIPSAKVGEVSGGCNPVPLGKKVENDKVVIKNESILEGKKYFTFKGGRK